MLLPCTPRRKVSRALEASINRLAPSPGLPENVIYTLTEVMPVTPRIDPAQLKFAVGAVGSWQLESGANELSRNAPNGSMLSTRIRSLEAARATTLNAAPTTWHHGIHVRSRRSDSAGFGRHPSKQKEVAAAQFAPVGQQQPVDRTLHRVADTYASELDRSAMRTVGSHSLQ